MRRRRRRFLKSLGLLALYVALCGQVAADLEGVKNVATSKDVPTSTITGAGGTTGTSFNVGDVVSTPGDVAARFNLASGGTATVGPGSEVRILAAGYFLVTGWIYLEHVTRGHLGETQYIRASIKSTSYMVRLSGSETEIIVLEGVVEIESAGAPWPDPAVAVPKWHRTVVRAGSPPEPVTPVSAAERQRIQNTVRQYDRLFGNDQGVLDRRLEGIIRDVGRNFDDTDPVNRNERVPGIGDPPPPPQTGGD